MDTTKSNRIMENYHNRSFKALRKRSRFSGNWETTAAEFFPLLCPAREADWLPGWESDLVYTESGIAEDNCVFKTEKSNPAGSGTWMFIGYEKDRAVEFVRFKKDMIVRCRITITDNGDGTITGTWDTLCTALTPQGNKEIEKMPADGSDHKPLQKMIAHYLKKGKIINKAGLVAGMVSNHFHGGSH